MGHSSLRVWTLQDTGFPSVHNCESGRILADLKKIYRSFAERYHALIAREDYESHLLPAILAIDPLVGKDVIELGAGTGRVTSLIAPITQRLVISDISHHMLSFGQKHLSRMGLKNLSFSLESHLNLPFANHTADVIIAGWSFCYAALDAEAGWQPALEIALKEVERILRPGGKLILIESLGTGYEKPHTPEVLVDYLDYLNSNGFDSTWIRTDYCFKDKAEAKDLTAFFFGDAPMPMWETEKGMIVPECTGLWWKAY